jgi:hypothetical protein
LTGLCDEILRKTFSAPSSLRPLTYISNVFDNLLNGTAYGTRPIVIARVSRPLQQLVARHAPSELGQLSALEVLRLQLNRFTGALPTHLARLSQLQHIRVNRNLFIGPLPALRSELMTW